MYIRNVLCLTFYQLKLEECGNVMNRNRKNKMFRNETKTKLPYHRRATVDMEMETPYNRSMELACMIGRQIGSEMAPIFKQGKRVLN